jgi:hypothetical protein
MDRKSLAKYLTEIPNNKGGMVSVLVLRTVLIPSSAWSKLLPDIESMLERSSTHSDPIPFAGGPS